ncbi:ankyrin repeat domain-containing protein 1-like [Zophobas morio]|uniref:ankyrin repeat domain-containing protein 1-like n=1 Tax=Zophobas morio TaxID=2755281 RepID=UPI003083C959
MPSDLPVHKAAYNGNLSDLKEAFKDLKKENKFDPDVPGAQHRTPLMRACGSSSDPKDVIKCAEYLISLGANVNAADDARRNCLHWAILGNNRYIVDFLMKQNIDINQQTSSGASPLHLAVKAGNAEMVSALMTFGSDKSLLWEGKTAGRLALELNHHKIANMLGEKKKSSKCILL